MSKRLCPTCREPVAQCVCDKALSLKNKEKSPNPHTSTGIRTEHREPRTITR